MQVKECNIGIGEREDETKSSYLNYILSIWSHSVRLCSHRIYRIYHNNNNNNNQWNGLFVCPFFLWFACTFFHVIIIALNSCFVFIFNLSTDRPIGLPFRTVPNKELLFTSGCLFVHTQNRYVRYVFTITINACCCLQIDWMFLSARHERFLRCSSKLGSCFDAMANTIACVDSLCLALLVTPNNCTFIDWTENRSTIYADDNVHCHSNSRSARCIFNCMWLCVRVSVCVCNVHMCICAMAVSVF